MVDLHHKIKNYADKNFGFRKGAAIQILIDMGLACVEVPSAVEICLETPVRATYECVKKVKDYYSRFQNK